MYRNWSDKRIYRSARYIDRDRRNGEKTGNFRHYSLGRRLFGRTLMSTENRIRFEDSAILLCPSFFVEASWTIKKLRFVLDTIEGLESDEASPSNEEHIRERRLLCGLFKVPFLTLDHTGCAFKRLTTQGTWDGYCHNGGCVYNKR